MRKLTKTEKRLSIIPDRCRVCDGKLLRPRLSLRLAVGALPRKFPIFGARQHSNDIWLKEKDLWLGRKRWIEATQPRIRANQVPQSELLESVTTSAKANQLEIQEQSFGENKSTPNYQSVAVRLKLGGAFKTL